MQFRLIYGNILFVIFLSLPVPAQREHFRRLNEWEYGKLLEKCGISSEDINQANFRIRFGSKARQGQFPWAVRIASDSDSEIGGGCTGTIISRHHIITAAHCFIDNENGTRNVHVINKFYVLGGTPCIYTDSMNSSKYVDCRSDEYKKPMSLLVSRIIIPKKSLLAVLSKATPPPDAEIAIFELSEPLDVNDEDIRPICLPKSDLNLPEKFVYHGFGATEEKGVSNQHLHWVEEEIGSLNEQDLKDKGMITMNYNPPKKNVPAGGDSGGGLIGSLEGRNYIFGVIWGVNRCEHQIFAWYSWFSNVLSKQDFICYYTGVCPLGYNKYIDPNYPKNPEAVVYISDGNGNEFLGKDDAVVMKQFCSDRREDCKENENTEEGCSNLHIKDYWCIGTCNPDCQNGSPQGLALP